MTAKRDRLQLRGESDSSTTYIVGKASDDRRRAQRWNIDVSVRELDPEAHVVRATRLSEGGMFWPYSPPRLPGEEVTVEVTVGRDSSIVARARVVHNGRGRDGMGVGMQFVGPQPELMAVLSQANQLRDSAS